MPMLIPAQAVFDGLVLIADNGQWVVDSVHPARDGHGVMVFLVGWHLEIGNHDKYIAVRYGLVRTKTGYQFGSNAPYRLTTLEPPDDPGLHAEHKRAVDVWDLRRGDYLSALHTVRSLAPEYLFKPWETAIVRRPIRIPSLEIKNRLAGIREVGSIRVRNEYDAVVDALVVDEHRRSATALSVSRLQSYADLWASSSLTVPEYIAWLSSQPLHPGMNWDTPKAGSREGYAEDIALAELAR